MSGTVCVPMALSSFWTKQALRVSIQPGKIEAARSGRVVPTGLYRFLTRLPRASALGFTMTRLRRWVRNVWGCLCAYGAEFVMCGIVCVPHAEFFLGKGVTQQPAFSQERLKRQEAGGAVPTGLEPAAYRYPGLPPWALLFRPLCGLMYAIPVPTCGIAILGRARPAQARKRPSTHDKKGRRPLIVTPLLTG